jgi:hypothetical protein
MKNPLFFQPTFGGLFDALPKNAATEPIGVELPTDAPQSTPDTDQTEDQL